MIDGILPAAGLASRMRGLPKFLLPCDETYTSLIEKHIEQMLEFCQTIWIPTLPQQTILLESLGLSSDRIVIVPMKTSTMTETVLRISRISGAKRFMMVMPDTFFYGSTPYEYLASGEAPLNLALWKIRPEQAGKLGQVKVEMVDDNFKGHVIDSRDKDPECRFPHSWGAMSFERSALEHASPEMPHTGYIINPLLQRDISVEAKIMDGEYFDCGTPTEYLKMLSKISVS